jgi:isoleucyl-tRNA synthetase
LGVGALFFGTAVWGVFKGAHNYIIRKRKLKLKNLPNSFKGLKIVQISDIHSGSFWDREAVIKGIELIGLKYPSFNQLLDINDKFNLNKEKLYQIIKADYVKDESGTGLVHLAPSFGEEDFNVCLENGLINNEGYNLNDYLDEDGKINDYLIEFKDKFYREVNELIINLCYEKKNII